VLYPFLHVSEWLVQGHDSCRRIEPQRLFASTSPTNLSPPLYSLSLGAPFPRST
jgi:hypothetical protein